jgi:hypothetical protein
LFHADPVTRCGSKGPFSYAGPFGSGANPCLPRPGTLYDVSVEGPTKGLPLRAASGRRKRGLLEGKLPKDEGPRPRQPEGSRPPSLLLLLRA